MATVEPNLTRGDPRDELIAVVAIMRANAVSATKLSALLDNVGSAIDLLRDQSMVFETGVRSLLLGAVGQTHIEAAAVEISAWEAAGYTAVTVLHPSYPTNLQEVFDKPPLLFVTGKWDDHADSRAVAVVGTRNPSADGRRRAALLVKTLTEASITVISGLAKGIDAVAHRAALKAGARTVAVMGTGIARRYPRENASLADAIVASGGALISQFFPTQGPTKWTFPVRNITMSGLSIATIVIEAGVTSGAMIQARAALTHGRSVFLPSSLVETHPWARALVEDGVQGAHATEVSSPTDVIDRLDFTLPEMSSLVA
jgi:DNA processing protein